MIIWRRGFVYVVLLYTPRPQTLHVLCFSVDGGLRMVSVLMTMGLGFRLSSHSPVISKEVYLPHKVPLFSEEAGHSDIFVSGR